MSLSDRKEKIIEAVVDSYINRCEPISSAEIKQNFLPTLSSATIRNELASLEELGYLAQPHTSAGRVPTADAYRLYVEKLMPKRRLSNQELGIIKHYFNHKVMEIDEVLKNTVKVISQITNLTSVAYVDNLDEVVIEGVKIVKITDSTALIVLVTDQGILKDAMANITQEVTEDYLAHASEFISTSFKGHTIYEIVSDETLVERIRREYEQIYAVVYNILKTYSHEDAKADIVFEGSSKILDQPEYANVSKARAMLDLLDAKHELIPVLQHSDDMNLNIVISKDNEIKQGAPECAIVTANYSINGVNIGKAGVIGPIRMDYSKVVSVLNHIGKTINLLPDMQSNNKQTFVYDGQDDET